MINVRIKIGSNGTIKDTKDYGLIFISSDNRVGNDSKGFESTSYPEQAGEHIIPKSVDAPFDYTVKFFIDPAKYTTGQTPSLIEVNKVISDFNAELYSQTSGSDVKEYKKVAFFNDYKGHKIVGYPYPIAEATDFWRDPKNHLNDVVVVEFKIRVTNPKDCEYTTPFSDDTSNQ